MPLARRLSARFPSSVAGMLVGFAMVTSGCSPRGLPDERALLSPVNPFVSALDAAPRDEATTFCLYPIGNSSDVVADDDPRLDAVEIAIREELERIGFTVAEASAFHSMQHDVFAAADPPAWNPLTGDYSSAGFRSATATLRSRAREMLGCTAFARPAVVRTLAPWIGSWAEWDGTGVRIASDWATSSKAVYGIIHVLSLHVRVEDAAGTGIYFGTGGIESLFELDGPFPTPDAYRSRDADVLLTDAEVLADAVRKATDQLRANADR